MRGRGSTPILKRNIEIKKLYNKLAKECVTGFNGTQEEKYKHRAILVMIGNKFFLEPGTINNILSTKA